MIGSYVQVSRETRRQFIIHELNLLGVYETVKGDLLEDLDYYALRSLLTVAQEAREIKNRGSHLRG